MQHLKNNIQNLTVVDTNGLVAQWITRLPTEQKIAGSSPAEVEKLFFETSLVPKINSILSVK